MKKILALILALAMLFTLAACSGDKKDDKKADDKKTDDKGGSKEITGETYNVGDFTVLVPEGWLEVPMQDMWAEDPEAVDPGKIQIIKDGESEFDLLTKAYIQFDYYAPEEDMMVPSSEWYDEVTELEPVVAGDITWNGFSAVSGGNPMTILYTGEAGEAQWQAVLWSQGENTIAPTDADVLAILASVAPAA